MARVVVGVYMARYPLGGMLSCSLQWPVGLDRLGHDVYVVEKAPWPDSCYDPRSGRMGDDGTYGVAIVQDLLEAHGLEGRFCFVDRGGRYHGLDRDAIQRVFNSADVFIDNGSNGMWLEEASRMPVKVYFDGEPGYRQMKMAGARSAGVHALTSPTAFGKQPLPAGSAPPADERRGDSYDCYYTVGRNIGTSASKSPTAGIDWRPIFHPVCCDLFREAPEPFSDRFTTVMNWRTHEPLEFEGVTYGQKDVEFQKFLDLPRRSKATLEIAVSGPDVPRWPLEALGWELQDAHSVTQSVGDYWEYILSSAGEFSVAKEVFVSTNNGWFSDRSAAYLASGRPVILQETGFSSHLPCGEGLFAVRSVAEAAAAIAEITSDPKRHGLRAREIAYEYLESSKVISGLLESVGRG